MRTSAMDGSTPVNHKRNAELLYEIRIRELRVKRLKKALMDAEPDSGEFNRLAHEIATEEQWIKYYNFLLTGPKALTENDEYARLAAFGEVRK